MATETISIACPTGAGPGVVLQVQHNGGTFNITVPPGVGPGQAFQAQLPAPIYAVGAPVAVPIPNVATAQQPVQAAATMSGAPLLTSSAVAAAVTQQPPVVQQLAAAAARTVDEPPPADTELAIESESEPPPDPRVSKGCCITRLDMRLRLEADLAEAEGPVQRCCVYKGFYESFLVFSATIATACLLVIQYAFVGRIQMTEGMAYPMFLEGTCVCNGTLCDNVIFTLNLTDDALLWESAEEPDVVQYWQAWNQTNLVLNGRLDHDMQRCTQNHNDDLCEKGCEEFACIGGLANYRMLLSPIEGFARLSMEDNACWTGSRENKNKTHDQIKTDEGTAINHGIGNVCEGIGDDSSVVGKVPITEESSCREAATSLGVSDFRSVVSVDYAPNGCMYYDGSSTDDVGIYLNTHPGSAVGTADHHKICTGDDDQDADDQAGDQDDRDADERIVGFNSNNSVIASFSIAGSMVFICLLAGTIAWQDFVGPFAPPGHSQARFALKEQWCKPQCTRMAGKLLCGNLHWAEHAGGFLGEFAYYYFASMPFNTFVAGFLQPGESLTGYNETITEDPDYQGAGLWKTSLDDFDTLLLVLFGGGCALQVALPCAVCFLCSSAAAANEVDKRQKQMMAVGVIGVLYGVCLSVMFVVNFKGFASSVSWDFSLSMFSVNFDWGSLSFPDMPSVNIPAAITAFSLAVARLSVLFTRFASGMLTFFSCRWCKPLNSVTKVVKKITVTQIKKLDQIGASNAAAGHLQAQAEEEAIELSAAAAMEAGMQAAMDKLEETVTEKVEEKVTEKVNKMIEGQHAEVKDDDDTEEGKEAVEGAAKIKENMTPSYEP